MKFQRLTRGIRCITISLTSTPVGKRLPPAALPRERDPVPIVREAGSVLGPYWRGAENLAPHRDLIP
jgi:hypothetical protein